MVYDEAWDETPKELVSTPSSGDESDTVGGCENRDCPYFSRVGDRFNYEHSPTSAYYLSTSYVGNRWAYLANRTSPSNRRC